MNPFANKSKDRLESIGESELIRSIKGWLGAANPRSPAGIGDDCAVFAATAKGVKQLLTTDPVLYKHHFDDSLSPEQVATKLVNRNLSDVAAMGGRPTTAIISLALDPRVSRAWVERFYRQAAKLAVQNTFAIVGGDVTSAPEDFVGAFLTLIGETLPPGDALLRHNATEGSPIYVTGSLGGTLREKHHSFTPRLAEGQWLARFGRCASCTDLSDGLGKDISNILAEGCAARIDCDALPVSDASRETSETSGKPALYHVFNDGEDYELLFALQAESDAVDFEQRWKQELTTPLTRIGTVENQNSDDSSRLLLDNAPKDFLATGYEHLRKA